MGSSWDGSIDVSRRPLGTQDIHTIAAVTDQGSLVSKIRSGSRMKPEDAPSMRREHASHFVNETGQRIAEASMARSWRTPPAGCCCCTFQSVLAVGLAEPRQPAVSYRRKAFAPAKRAMSFDRNTTGRLQTLATLSVVLGTDDIHPKRDRTARSPATRFGDYDAFATVRLPSDRTARSPWRNWRESIRVMGSLIASHRRPQSPRRKTLFPEPTTEAGSGSNTLDR